MASTYDRRPSDEAQRLYEAGKEAEANGDLKTAISFYKRAEKLGHSLEAPDHHHHYATSSTVSC